MALTTLFALLRLRLRIAKTEMIQLLLQGALVPAMSLVILTGLGPTARVRGVLGAALLSSFAMMMRAPATGTVADVEFGTRKLLTQVAGVGSSLLALSYCVEAFVFALLPAAIIVIAVATGMIPAPKTAAWIVPFVLTLCWLYGLGQILAWSSLRLRDVLLVADIMILATVALCPIFYDLNAASPLLRPLVAWMPPTISIETELAAWAGRPLTGLIVMIGWTTGILVLLFGLGRIRHERP